MGNEKQLPRGVTVRGDTINITFTFKGVRCREPLSNLPNTTANAKACAGRAAGDRHRIGAVAVRSHRGHVAGRVSDRFATEAVLAPCQQLAAGVAIYGVNSGLPGFVEIIAGHAVLRWGFHCLKRGVTITGRGRRSGAAQLSAGARRPAGAVAKLARPDRRSIRRAGGR